jgi:hypothetical protein
LKEHRASFIYLDVPSQVYREATLSYALHTMLFTEIMDINEIREILLTENED